jgi:hypothetical protein
MDRHLTADELSNTRGFISLVLGKRIVPVKIVASSVPKADGFKLICWANPYCGWQDNRDPIAMFFPGIYPVEDVGERFREKKQRVSRWDSFLGVSLPIERDSSLVKGKKGIYYISPRTSTGGISFYYPDDLSYGLLAQRLKQEEFSL